MELLGVDLDTTIGRLHRFWWWCVDYAENGNLKKYDFFQIGTAIGLDKEQSDLFVKSMIEAGFIDQSPYFRVHDWWTYIGRFLKSKYKNYEHKWVEVEKLYVSKKGTTKGTPKVIPKDYPKPQLPNLTKPNLTNLTKEGDSVAVETAPPAPVPKSEPRPKDLDAVIEYMQDTDEARKFYAYYESNGWRVGKNPMKNWKAAAQNWLSRAGKKIPSQHVPRTEQDKKEFERIYGIKL